MSYWKLGLHIAVYLSLIAMVGPLGNAFCRCVFRWSKLIKTPPSNVVENKQASEDVDQRAGRLIGLLERTLILAGILLRSFEVLVAVVALKTVARYKELDKQINAEYFLIGSMASILFAVFIAVVLIGYDHYVGLDFFVSAGRILSKGSN